MSSKAYVIVATLLLLSASAVYALLEPAQVLNTLNSSGDYSVESDIVYAPATGLRLDVYRPRATKVKPPIVIFFYGGSWNNGVRAMYRFVGAALAEQGFIAVVPDYRLYPQVRYPQFLQDCAQAVAWTVHAADNYGGDAQRIYLMGHSAGAYNAAMLALDPRWLGEQGLSPSLLKGWIGLAGPYDFFPSNNLKVQPVFMHPNYPLGAQPIEYVDAAAAAAVKLPAFIGAASVDDLVNPHRNSEQLALRLRAAGAPVTFKLYEDVNHLTLIGAMAWPFHRLAPVLDDVAAFIRNG